jgi:hypothetical protein
MCERQLSGRETKGSINSFGAVPEIQSARLTGGYRSISVRQNAKAKTPSTT